MKVQDVYGIIDAFAPFDIAMEDDNSGLLIGSFGREVARVLVTLDADESALKHARDAGCDMIVSHHPFFFRGENAITDATPQGRKILAAAKQGAAILCAHTNLDSCDGGINDTLGKLLGLTATGRFLPTQGGGMLGRIGTHRFESKEAFLSHAARVLHVRPRYRFTNGAFENIAWVSGSGAFAMRDAVKAGADTLVTGDVKYSAFMDAAELGVNVIDLGHFETEQIIVPVIAKLLKENGVQVTEHIVPSPIAIWEK